MTTKINLANIDTAQDYSTLATALYAKANSTSNTANTAYTAALTILKVTSIVYPGNDTAADTAGGQTITLTGTGFVSGASVLVDGTAVSVVSVVTSTTLTFTSPVKTAGSYVIYVVNPDGGTAISIPGIQYSGTPAWTTAAGSIGSLYETAAFSNTVIATGDTVTYSLNSGTLPPGATFSSNGTITGTSSTLSSPTTYTFIVRATDAQNQDTDRSFSITINPDVITWSSPTNGTAYTLTPNAVMSNVTLSATSAVGASLYYYANTLPTGVSITGSTIFGTPTVSNETASSLITAVANTTSESANVFVTWTISVANDTYFKNTILLLSADKTPFTTDASANNFQVTVAGDTKPNSFSPYTPGYYSNYFDGTGDYLGVPSSASFAYGTGDYTLECWIYPIPAGKISRLVQYSDGVDGIEINSNAGTYTVGYINYYNGSGSTASATAVVSNNAWSHIAVVRLSGTVRVYVNGVLALTQASTPNKTAQSLAIGGSSSDATFSLFYGNISNFRVVKGTAVYTAAFTPPTTPLTAIANTSLLTCQSNRLIDTSNNTFAITRNGDTTVSSFDPFVPNSSYSTYGSAYFDGTGDYLSIPSTTAFSMGTGDFTIEGWVYMTAYSAGSCLFGTTNGATTGYYVNLGTDLNSFRVVSNASGTWADIITASAGNGIPLNQWVHVAFVRNGANITLYKNGVSVVTASGASAYNFTSPNNAGYVGYVYNGTTTQYLTGYVEDVRVVKGTAIYTTAFTPPTTPLTAVANTSLLTLQNNQPLNNSVFLDNSSNNLLVTRAGNTTQGTFSPYGANWSNYFSGSGDTFLALNSGAQNFYDGRPLTVEGWFFASASSDNQIATNYGTSSTGWGVGLYAGKLSTSLSGDVADITGTTTVILNTWNHFALSGTAGSWKQFLNGVQEGSTYTGSVTLNSSATLTIGALRWSGATYSRFSGYISNVRVTQSLIYTTTFTPPSQPLTPVANTYLLTCNSNTISDSGPNNIQSIVPYTAGGVSVQRFSPFSPVTQTPQTYSGYFDGTGDYLSVADNAAIQLGSSNFTIEMWVYPTTTGAWWLLGKGDAASAAGSQISFYNGATNWDFYYGGSNSLGVAKPTLDVNVWQHIAVVRNTTTITIYKNGTSVSSGSIGANSLNTGGGNPLTIGYYSSAGIVGYISNFRLVKGTALYTTTFTPSTTPLTTVSNTSILTCQSQSFIDNSPNAFPITVTGDAKPRVFNPFGVTNTTGQAYTPALYGGSAYFDGTGDYLSVPSTTTALTFGTSDFTVEFWFYQTATMTSEYTIIETQTTNAFVIYKISQSGGLSYRGYASGNDQTLISHSNLLLNTWYHIAVSRTSGVTKGFVNGAQVFSVADTLTYAQPAVTPTIGSRNGGTNSFPGYISDFRIVRGTGVYTSAFVPPAVPLTAITNTTLLLDAKGGAIIDNSMSNNIETVGDVKISTANSKFGGSSMYFDGTGDYLINGGNSSSGLNAFGTSDFTIEFWLYENSVGASDQGLIDMRPTSLNGYYPYLYSYNGTIIYWLNSAAAITSSAGAITTGTWYHIALSRSGSSNKLFINGTQSGSTFTSTTALLCDNNRPVIGCAGVSLGASPLNGYIDDFRITKGVARYTANFTPPTALIKQ